MAAQYAVGDFVDYRGENIAVIDRIIHPLSSYRSYEVTDIDSGRKSVAMKHELSHTEITDVMVIDGVSEMADFPVKPDKKSTAPKKERFAQVTEKEIEDLANSRLEKSTKKQTAWAVKILRGLFTSYCLCPHQCPPFAYNLSKPAANVDHVVPVDTRALCC